MGFDRYDEHDDTTEAHERRIRRCTSCNAQIIWLPTENSRMPVDASTVEADHDVYLPGIHRSHFATCPNADQHRKKKGK